MLSKFQTLHFKVVPWKRSDLFLSLSLTDMRSITADFMQVGNVLLDTKCLFVIEKKRFVEKVDNHCVI